LDDQKPKNKPNKLANVELLKGNLDFAKSHIEKLLGGDKIVVIPIKTEFNSAKNIDGNVVPNFIAIFDSVGNIKKGNIVFYLPSDNVSPLTEKSFAAIFSSKAPTCNGLFKFLSVSGTFQFQMNFKASKLQSIGSVKTKSNSTQKETAETCTDWYLVTTYYYSDGTTQTSEQYLTTTCSSCDDPMEASLSPDGGGGGSGSRDEQSVYDQIVANLTVESASDLMGISTKIQWMRTLGLKYTTGYFSNKSLGSFHIIAMKKEFTN